MFLGNACQPEMRLFPFLICLDTTKKFVMISILTLIEPAGGGGILPYKGLMGTCGQPGYVFQDFCLKQGIKFIFFLS